MQGHRNGVPGQDQVEGGGGIGKVGREQEEE